MNKILLGSINIFTYSVVAGLVVGCQSDSKQLHTIGQPAFSIPSHLPNPPLGYEWSMVKQMSDEFDGNQLDKSKWRDHITTWPGRPPAEFLPANVSVSDGLLKLKTSTHPRPNRKFSTGGSAVSGKTEINYGYFEARIKASKTKMSTTFWLHSDKTEDKALGCEAQHTIELDILETLGGWPEDSWSNVMHSNTHYKPWDLKNGKCQRAPYISKGVKYDTGGKLSDDFNTYALWWATANQMHYYFNGKLTGTVNLDNPRDELPFAGPMSLRMVVETYDWQTKIAKGWAPYPSEAELDDMSINTAFYDHVRTYRLQPSANNLVENGDFEKGQEQGEWEISGSANVISQEKGVAHTRSWGAKIKEGDSLSQTISIKNTGTYQLSAYGKIEGKQGKLMVSAEDSQGKLLGQIYITEDEYELAKKQILFSAIGDIKVTLTAMGQHKAVLDNVALIPIL